MPDCSRPASGAEFDRQKDCPYDEKVGIQSRILCLAGSTRLQDGLYSRLLPPRSMVGQLPLEQHIGVRIPGGQPSFESKAVPDSSRESAEVHNNPKHILDSNKDIRMRSFIVVR